MSNILPIILNMCIYYVINNPCNSFNSDDDIFFLLEYSITPSYTTLFRHFFYLPIFTNDIFY